MTLLSASLDRPLLSVRDRQGSVLRARGVYGRRGRRWLSRASTITSSTGGWGQSPATTPRR